jgi:hypothetical protein
MRCLLVHLFLLVIQFFFAGSRFFLTRQEQQQIGAGVTVAKAQRPFGHCSRATQHRILPNRVIPTHQNIRTNPSPIAHSWELLIRCVLQ